MIPSPALRLQKVLTYTKLNTLEFSKTIGLSQATKLYHISAGQYGITSKLAKAIVAAYPDISFEYLTNGTGPMLAHRPTDPVHHKLKALETQMAQYQKLQGLNTFLEKLQ